jgi:predicted nucleic acid-binding protein
VSAFLDTTVLVYAIDRSEPAKRKIAQELLARRADDSVVSAQVLSELYAVITRKFRDSITPEQAASFVDRISNLPVVAIDAELVRVAIAISRDAQLSYWDGLILAAARVAGCDVVLTEDLSHGSTIAGVRIENPFAL